MDQNDVFVNQILHGDCLKILEELPEKIADVIFADPPYFLQLQHKLWRPDHSVVEAVNDQWDQFSDVQAYDHFSRIWLAACRRVLKDNGTIWVIGTYHNIFRIGTLMQDLGYWFLNDIVWIKTNPMPNFKGVRFTNAHETLIWASHHKGARYRFNYQSMKAMNEDLQMRSDWHLPLCTGPERIKQDGKKVHSTQKPEALLYRIILATTQPGDLILDPFFGTGTTGAVAKKLERHWVGIEQDAEYVRIANDRIAAIQSLPVKPEAFRLDSIARRDARIPFGALLESGLLTPGQLLFFNHNRSCAALVKADGRLLCEDHEGSIHQVARILSGDKPVNGWEVWFYDDPVEGLVSIDCLRSRIRKNGLK